MKSYRTLICIALCLSQNAYAQFNGMNNLGNNLANQVSGNSVVSNNIGIGNYGGIDLSGFSSKTSNSGSNLASNILNNVASYIGGNLAANVGSNLANNIVNKIAGNSVVSNNIGIGNNLANSNLGLGSNLANFGTSGGVDVGSFSSSVNNLANNNIVTGTNFVNSVGNANFGNLAGGVDVSSFSNSVSNLAESTNNFANNIGSVNFGANLGNGVVDVGSFSSPVGNLAVSNLASGIGAGLTANNFVGNVGGISNFRVGEIELVNDVSVNRGYSGEYPIIGYVTFEGYIPAEGTVSVAKDCGCTGS